MNRSTAVAALFALVLSSAFVFASIEFRRMSGTLTALDERLAKIEGGPARGDSSAPVTADGSPDRRNSSGASSDVATELARIREEITALRNSSGDHSSGSAGTSGTPSVASAGGPGLNKEDLSKALHEALAQKDKADKEKQSKQYRKQLEVSAKSYADNLTKPLGLTESQKGQIATIFVEQWSKMNTIYSDTGDTDNAEPVDYNKIQQETNEKIKLLLTPEQATKYDEMMKKGNWWGGNSGEEGTDDSSENSKSSR